MDEEPPNLLRTEPIRRRIEQGLTDFILAYADDLRARRDQGERAEDILPLVEKMLGRSIKPVTFASLLSRHVPIRPKKSRPTLTFEVLSEQRGQTAPTRAKRQRAREPPAPSSSDAVLPAAAASHSEQAGIARPIKPKPFLPK